MGAEFFSLIVLCRGCMWWDHAHRVVRELEDGIQGEENQ